MGPADQPEASAEQRSALGFSVFVDRLLGLLDVSVPGPTTEYTSLSDEWSLDSIQVFQVFVMTETLAGAMTPPMELPELHTVGDVYAYYLDLRQRDDDGIDW